MQGFSLLFHPLSLPVDKATGNTLAIHLNKIILYLLEKSLGLRLLRYQLVIHTYKRNGDMK